MANPVANTSEPEQNVDKQPECRAPLASSS